MNKLNLRDLQSDMDAVFGEDKRPEPRRRRSDWRRERHDGHDPGRVSKDGPTRAWRASDLPLTPRERRRQTSPPSFSPEASPGGITYIPHRVSAAR